MATRSIIGIKVKPTDIGLNKKFTRDNLPKGKGYYDTHIDALGEVNIMRPFLSVYCHFDGYVNGVGKTLLTEFDDYDKALNLILGGATSSLTGDLIQYCAACGEDWEDCAPVQSTPAEDLLKEEYAYLYQSYVDEQDLDDNGKPTEKWQWYVRSPYKSHGIPDWTPLREVLKEN